MAYVVKKEVSPPENSVECKTEPVEYPETYDNMEVMKPEPVEYPETYDNMEVMKTEMKEELSYSGSGRVEVKQESYDMIEVSSSEEETIMKGKKKFVIRLSRKGKKKFLHACTICNYTTAQKRDLVVHNYSHNEDKPCKCVICGLTTKGTEKLNVHMLLVHGDANRMFKCNLCGFCAYRKGLLRAHMHEHSLQNPFKCVACGYLTTKKNKLARHLVIWHSEDGKWFRCRSCGFKTADSQRLKKHEKRVHGKCEKRNYSSYRKNEPLTDFKQERY